MKKFCFLSSIFVLFFISCSLNQEQKGSLSITLPEAGTTRSLQEDVVKFQVTVSGPTARTTPFIAPGTVIPIDDLIPGFYTVSVYGYDNNSKKIAQGTNTAAVEGGIKNDVTVEISRAPQDPWEYEPHEPEIERLVAEFLGFTTKEGLTNPYLYNDKGNPTNNMFKVFLDGTEITNFSVTPVDGYSFSDIGTIKVKITSQGENFTYLNLNVRHKLEAKIRTDDETLSFNNEGYVSIGINLCAESGLKYNGNNTLNVSEVTESKVTCTLKGSGNLLIGSKVFNEDLGNEIKLYKSDFTAATSGTPYDLEVIVTQLASTGYENCFENGSDTKTFKITF